MYYSLLFFTFLIFRVVDSMFSYYFVSQLINKYKPLKWYHDGKDKEYLLERRHTFKRLMDKAKVSDYSFGVFHNTMGGVVRSQVTVLESFPSAEDQTIIETTLRMMHEAKGIFKYRVFESFNPFYWLLTVPKNLFLSTNISSKNARKRKFLISLIQGVWTIFWTCIFPLLAVTYPLEVANMLKDFITSYIN